MHEVALVCPRMLSSNLMDDIGLTGIGTAEEVVREVTTASDIALRHLKRLGLALSEGKSVILASRKTMETALLRHLGPEGFVVRSQHRVLGLEGICSRRRRTCMQRQRLTIATKRLKRVARLRRACRRSLHLAVRSSPCAALLYGSTQVGYAPSTLRGIRRRFMRSMVKLPLRAATGLFSSTSRTLTMADPGHHHHAR
eukprot:1955323-Amphidinium_carterae.1